MFTPQQRHVMQALSHASSPAAWAEAYAVVRAHSVALIEPLSAEDCQLQSMPDASPSKWHLAHTTWFFETFVLERFEPRFRPFDASFRVLFNSTTRASGRSTRGRGAACCRAPACRRGWPGGNRSMSGCTR
jgi:hypothetical protein